MVLVIHVNDEMFRQALIELMDKGLLNKFVNLVFKYRLKDTEYVYMQYKIVKNNIVLNIFDNSRKNRFKGYIFTKNGNEISDNNIIYVNIDDCYQKYKEKKTKNKLFLIGALLKADRSEEKKEIIEYFEDKDIKKVLKKFFLGNSQIF